MDGTVRISECARRLGVTPYYLRTLEWQGRIPEVGYDRVGRFYTEADIELLKAMGVGNKPRRLRPADEV